MCSGTDANNETDFEVIVSKLMKLDGDGGMCVFLLYCVCTLSVETPGNWNFYKSQPFSLISLDNFRPSVILFIIKVV